MGFIENHNWQLLDTKMPKGLGVFGCTIAVNDKYVLIFGGWQGCSFYTDDIWVYSVKNKTFRKSSINCPEKGRYQAFTVNDKQKDETAVFGFIRNEWKLLEIPDHLFPPHYLMGAFIWT